MSAFISKTVLKITYKTRFRTLFFLKKTRPPRTGICNLFVQILETDFDNCSDNILKTIYPLKLKRL